MKDYIKVYYCMMDKRGATYGGRETLMKLSELIDLADNSEVITKNRRKLSGLNRVILVDDGRKLITQLSGYNGNVGMYCYLAQPDNTLAA